VSEFLAFTIVGIVTGSVYAIAAGGLVVTYVTSGIFNIAHGAIGMLAAFAYWQFRVDFHMPAMVALIIVVVILAPLFGAFIERVLMRGLAGAPIGVSLVVTVGLMVGLIGLAQTIWKPTEARQLPGFFAPSGIRLGSIFVTWHEAITILASGAVAIFLWLFLSRSRTGIAMRAVVDDRNLTALTGARPHRVSQLAWAIGAMLAAIAGILLAPVLQLNVTVLTLLVVNAYAAAMAGRLRSLPLTFIGGLGLGLLESYVVGYANLSGALQGLRPALPTIVLFILLLLMPEARLRAGRLVGAVTPRVPGFRESLLGAVAFVAIAGIVSTLLGTGDLVRVGQGLSFAIIMLSLVLLTGYGGQVSLAQMTFAGLGAFMMAKIGVDLPFIGLILGAVLAAGVGALVALPALRLQGLYLALATMAFAVLMEKMFFPNQDVFGSLGALPIPRLTFLGLSFEGEKSYFMLLAIAFSAMGIIVLAIRRGPFGRVLSAMRDSPVACATLGLKLTRTKLAVFMLSAGMAGIGGALYGGLRGSAGDVDFLMLQSLPLLLLAVIGGINSVSGALVGGLLYASLPIIQEKVPSISGLVFLMAGGAGILLGRNPNGVSFLITNRVRQLTARKPERATVVEPSVPEEVSGVAAARG
jgi:branched-chain amino acid transport system permease protein